MKDSLIVKMNSSAFKEATIIFPRSKKFMISLVLFINENYKLLFFCLVLMFNSLTHRELLFYDINFLNMHSLFYKEITKWIIYIIFGTVTKISETLRPTKID